MSPVNIFRMFRKSGWEPEVRTETGIDVELSDRAARKAISTLTRGGAVLELTPEEYQAMIATGRLKETDEHYKGLQIVKLES